jgi:hypothetical protein
MSIRLEYQTPRRIRHSREAVSITGGSKTYAPPSSAGLFFAQPSLEAIDEMLLDILAAIARKDYEDHLRICQAGVAPFSYLMARSPHPAPGYFPGCQRRPADDPSSPIFLVGKIDGLFIVVGRFFRSAFRRRRYHGDRALASGRGAFLFQPYRERLRYQTFIFSHAQGIPGSPPNPRRRGGLGDVGRIETPA